MEVLALLSRWLHILAAMAAVGGPLFIRFALIPAVDETLPESERKALHARLRKRWSRVVMAAIALLLITGLYNFILLRNASQAWGPSWQSGGENARLYQILFGIKVLLALGVFFLASALTGSSAAFEPIRAKARMWVTITLLLGVLIVCISGQMRMLHIGPNPAAAAAVDK